MECPAEMELTYVCRTGLPITSQYMYQLLVATQLSKTLRSCEFMFIARMHTVFKKQKQNGI